MILNTDSDSSSNSRYLIVSLHDVAPPTWGLVRRQLDILTALGVQRASLLAVPHYHQLKRLDEDPDLGKWLRDCQDQGHEIVLHGWTHESSTLDTRHSTRISWKTWFYQNYYTSFEGEFLDLNYDQARCFLEKGLEMFWKSGLKISGFIAPAWLMNLDVERAARDLGISYSNTISGIVRLSDGKRFPASSCVWSTRARWRRWCSLAWNESLFRRMRGANPLRISLHPNDLEFPVIWGQITRLVAMALATRQTATYADWMGKAA